MAWREKEAEKGERVFWQKERSRYQNKRVTLEVVNVRHRAQGSSYQHWRGSRKRPIAVEAPIVESLDLSKKATMRPAIWRRAYQLESTRFVWEQGFELAGKLKKKLSIICWKHFVQYDSRNMLGNASQNTNTESSSRITLDFQSRIQFEHEGGQPKSGIDDHAEKYIDAMMR